jgi:hypothetical protein
MMKHLLIFLIASIMLSACTGIYFSPEAAALAAVQNNGDPNFTIDPNSLEIHQSHEMDDGSVVVLMSYRGTRALSGPESCMNAYRLENKRLGWQPSSGSGSCQTQNPAEGEISAMGVGAGQSGSSRPGDPGFSQTYGTVSNPSIVKVRVTWNDTQVDQVDVIKGSFVNSRLGLFTMQQVEGLDEQGNVVYAVGGHAPTTGKQ